MHIIYAYVYINISVYIYIYIIEAIESSNFVDKYLADSAN